MQHSEKLNLITTLVSSYLGANQVSIDQLPQVFSAFDREVEALINPQAVAPVEAKKEPAISIKKSVQPEYIVDLFSGAKFKSLKRHLRTKHQMTPAEYRSYWNLPADYPMVAPNYAARRSELAKASGLGQGGRQAAKAPKAAAPKATRARKAAAPKAPKVTAPKIETPAEGAVEA